MKCAVDSAESPPDRPADADLVADLSRIAGLDLADATRAELVRLLLSGRKADSAGGNHAPLNASPAAVLPGGPNSGRAT